MTTGGSPYIIDSNRITGDTRDVGSISGSGRSSGVGGGNPPPYSCLENFMDRGAWQTAVHEITKSQMRLSTAQQI